MQNETPHEELEPRDFYYPREVAERLGVSVEMLAYYRRIGKISGRYLGNITVYTEAQIQAADLTPRTRGPKAGKRSKGREQHIIDGNSPTVVYVRKRRASRMSSFSDYYLARA